jgi:Tfp pilus assembly protein PilW
VISRLADRGTTLAELAVAMFVSGVVVALAAQIVISVTRDTNTAITAANRVDSVRLALDAVDRQVRSGAVLYIEPSGGTCSADGSGGNCLRVATQADGTTSCVQLQLVPDQAGDGSQVLRSRTYSPDWASGGVVGAWRQVTNELAAPTSAGAPFILARQSGVGSQALTVQFAAPQTSSSAAPIKLTATYVPRNALYAASAACSGGAPA